PQLTIRGPWTVRRTAQAARPLAPGPSGRPGGPARGPWTVRPTVQGPGTLAADPTRPQPLDRRPDGPGSRPPAVGPMGLWTVRRTVQGRPRGGPGSRVSGACPDLRARIARKAPGGPQDASAGRGGRIDPRALPTRP